MRSLWRGGTQWTDEEWEAYEEDREDLARMLDRKVRKQRLETDAFRRRRHEAEVSALLANASTFVTRMPPEGRSESQ